MSRKRYPEEFKIEAVKQVTDAGYSAYAFGRCLHHQSSNMKSWSCYVSNQNNNPPVPWCGGPWGLIQGHTTMSSVSFNPAA
jgi:hypothetical protein